MQGTSRGNADLGREGTDHTSHSLGSRVCRGLAARAYLVLRSSACTRMFGYAHARATGGRPLQLAKEHLRPVFALGAEDLADARWTTVANAVADVLRNLPDGCCNAKVSRAIAVP